MEDSDSEGPNTQQRLGRLVFRIGLCLLAMALILGALAATASALSLSPMVASELGRFSVPVLVIGLLMLVVGLIAWKMPRGIEGDQLWIMKTGPFIRGASI